MRSLPGWLHSITLITRALSAADLKTLSSMVVFFAEVVTPPSGKSWPSDASTINLLIILPFNMSHSNATDSHSKRSCRQAFRWISHPSVASPKRPIFKR